MNRASSTTRKGAARAGLFAAVLLLVVAGCGGSDSNTIRGLVASVEAQSITEVALLTLEVDGSGELLTFEAEGHIGMTPSHIREHMLRGETVSVRYREEGGRLIAVLVTD